MALENNDQEYIKRLERLVDKQAELLNLQRDIIHMLAIPRPIPQPIDFSPACKGEQKCLT